jgi:NTP pyrophosphatase (non-canonical NTP hydrolase)
MWQFFKNYFFATGFLNKVMLTIPYFQGLCKSFFIVKFECNIQYEFMDKYKAVIEELIRFRNERDWEQFHDSKNLALAISIEAAELNELFLWKKGNDVENINKDRLKEELADILSFSFLLAEKHNLDIFDIVSEKIRNNALKYPVDKAKGTAKKYDEL